MSDSRAGGKWEAVGFLVIVAGIITFFFKPETATFLFIGGFITFLVGRFK